MLLLRKPQAAHLARHNYKMINGVTSGLMGCLRTLFL